MYIIQNRKDISIPLKILSRTNVEVPHQIRTLSIAEDRNEDFLLELPNTATRIKNENYFRISQFQDPRRESSGY